MRRPRAAFAVLLALILAAACERNADDRRSTPPLSATTTPPSHPAVATQPPALVHLQQDYEQLSKARRTMSDIWEGLASGKSVRCGNYPEVPSPSGITDEGDVTYSHLAATLRDAAIALNQSITLWKAECSSPRPNPSPERINEGRLSTRRAGDLLGEASQLLSAIR